RGILIDDFTQFSQVISQDGLSGVKHRAAVDGNCDRSQCREDCDDDHQLEKSESATRAQPTSLYISSHPARSPPTSYKHQKRFGLPMIRTSDRLVTNASPIPPSSSWGLPGSCAAT